MADENLRKPRRKNKARFHLLESPFPVPIFTWTRKPSSNKLWYYYFATLKADHVCVSRKGDLTFLYRLGFFGKGMLSQSRPHFEKYNDVLSEERKKFYLGKFAGLEDESREEKLILYHDMQDERLRQHSSWKNLRKDRDLEVNKNLKVNYCSDSELPQCADLHTEIDDGLLEDLSSDSNIELNDNLSVKRPLSPQLKSIRKKIKFEDEYKLYEYLQLTFEEAFFLSYGIGCLGVVNNDGVGMSLNEMWQTYCGKQADFVQIYIAYHYFRSKGWVVRMSHLYNSDFLLYKDGMPFYHASYSVFVKLVDESTLNSLDNNKTSWQDLSSISRICERIAKEILICYVIKPKSLKEEHFLSPECIKEFKVVETVFRRWIPEKHREKNQ